MAQSTTVLAIFIATLLASHFYISSMGDKNKLESQFEQSNLSVQFNNWKQSLGKFYKSESENSYRLAIFKESLEKILAHEQLGKTYTLGLTQFADMTDDEFKNTILMKTRDSRHGSNVQYNSSESKIKGAMNWVKYGAVNAIQDQGVCGSCYTFATAAATEGASAIQSPYGLQKFSEQQIVSCSQSYGNDGCEGGFGQYSFQYVIEHGLTYESDFPYVSGADGKVPQCTVDQGAFFISAFRDVVGRGSCSAIQKQVVQQPLYGRVNADNWKLYAGGVFDGSQCITDPNKIDHAITIVGFDTTSSNESEQFWIIRNSWGTSWGENGYMKLKYGNSCSVCYEAFAPQY